MSTQNAKVFLVLGSGARENAIGWRLKQSPFTAGLYFLPGNPNTAHLGTNLSGNPEDVATITQYLSQYPIDAIICGPEAPLVAGVADALKENPVTEHIPFLGPDAFAAQLEGSKAFSKSFMERHNIPTAKAKTFTAAEFEEAKTFMASLGLPVVLKADGLAAGKGVIIPTTAGEAEAALKEMLLESKFGKASEKVLIEQFLTGIELSYFILSDGLRYIILPEAKDYKRVGEGDSGPNTGGMGSISPVPFVNDAFRKKIDEKIIKPTLAGMAMEGHPYKGFLFIGLMKVGDEPFVIEYNVRLGDPETQSLMLRLGDNFAEACFQAAQGELKITNLEISAQTACTIVLCAEHYPETPAKGDLINLPTEIPSETQLFMAGASLNEAMQLVTSGGRVISVSSLGDSIPAAQALSLATAKALDFRGKHFRSDIGNDLLPYLVLQ